jgi:DNA polymerase III alpha subunit
MNTAEIAEAAASAELLPGSWVFPGYRGLSDRETASELYRLCREGVVRRYGKISGTEKAAAIEKRLQYEMNIICRKGFAS